MGCARLVSLVCARVSLFCSEIPLPLSYRIIMIAALAQARTVVRLHALPLDKCMRQTLTRIGTRGCGSAEMFGAESIPVI